MRLLVLLTFSALALSANVATVAGALSIAASSGTIVREGHDLATHFKRTMKKHAADMKRAFQGKK